TGGEAGSIFISDGTDPGTSLVQTGFPGSLSPANWTVFNGKAYFTETSSLGNELWSSDGTTYGTVMNDIYPGYGSSAPAYLVATADYLYFAATDQTNGRQLWRIDKVSGVPTRITSGLNVQQISASA